jgi:hypothetical protein
MKDDNTPAALAQLESMALSHPHQLFATDRILKTDIGAFVSHITFGNGAPNGQVIAVATLTLSTAKLKEMATSIVEKIDAQHESIRKELKAFEAKLPRASR